MDIRQIEELLPFYALDALTDEEREQVEVYLRKRPEARAQMEEMRSAALALPYGITLMEPPRRSKDALMARVAADQRVRGSSKQEQPSRPRVMRLENLFQMFSLGAAIAAILWAVVLNSQLSQLRKEVSALGTALVAQSNSIDQLNNSVNQINANTPKVNPSNVITVSLKGTDTRPQAQGQLIADPNSRSAVLVIAGLAPLEAGKVYQVWLIEGSTPRSAGFLAMDVHGQAILILNSESVIGSFDALGISIEPEQGSQQPTGDIVVLSDL
ncbi:MAG: anti-sigma factor [Chloroflexi bacterium]|nr:anti-sigma factor [Chloroflexota bacterium]